MLHMDGTAGAAGFVDSSTTPHVVTATGGLHSAAQVQFGITSGAFDGTDVITVPDSASRA